MRWIVRTLELFLPGLALYRRGKPVASFVMILLFMASAIGLTTYYTQDRMVLTMIVSIAQSDSIPTNFMGLIPRVEETYITFNPTKVGPTLAGYDLRLGKPIWPGNRPMPYPEFPLLVRGYHGLFILLLFAHGLILRRFWGKP